jgi:hypothetical protein
MPFLKVLSLPKPVALPTVEGARHWWHKLTPHRQDRLAVLAPLASVLLFFAAIVAALGYLRLEEMDREQEAVQRDVEYTQQRLRLRLLERQEQMTRIARDLSNRDIDLEEFRQRAASMADQYPEVQGMAWIDDKRRTRASLGMGKNYSGATQYSNNVLSDSSRDAGYALAREVNQPL